VIYDIENIQKAEEENYYSHVDSNTNLHCYHYKRGRRIIIRTYGATTVHYSYKKAS
jgi:hypothetical protein